MKRIQQLWRTAPFLATNLKPALRKEMIKLSMGRAGM
jgi:hypothetical protein